MFEFAKNLNRVLVVAAHPDDEILGCGGTVHRLTKSGIEVQSLILAEGVTSRLDKDSRPIAGPELEALKKAAHLANKEIGVNTIELHSFPDNRMDSVDLLEVVKVVESKVLAFKPQVVLTHHASDLNVDHRVVEQAVLAATRPQPGNVVKAVLYFETASSTEWQFSQAYSIFRPQLFVDISQSIAAKLMALNQYSSEMRQWPHSRSLRSIEYCAKWRGAGTGVEAAEAFEVGRILI